MTEVQLNLSRIACLSSLVVLAGCDIDMDVHAFGHERFTEEFSQEHAMQPGGRLAVDNQNGGVEVVGWDQDRVLVRATKYAPTQAALADLKIDVRVSPGVCEVRTWRPAVPAIRGRSGVSYRIQVPARTRLENVGSTNGSIRAESIQGDVRLHSTNGSVRLFQVSGDAHVHTTNGRVELRAFKGAANMETTNGSISAEGVRGRLDAHTTNGSIDVVADEFDSSAVSKLRTTNGHVNLTVASTNVGAVEVGTTNGGVRLRMPASVSARLRASTTNSTISTNFPVERHMDRKRKRLDATLGSGGPTVSLQTTNGGIKIEAN
jgi:hypothetical protein